LNFLSTNIAAKEITDDHMLVIDNRCQRRPPHATQCTIVEHFAGIRVEHNETEIGRYNQAAIRKRRLT